MIDQELKKFATPRQAEIIDAINEHGSGRKAAIALGVHQALVHRAVIAVKKKAALQGYAPEFDMTRQVPAPFTVKGISTYYNKDGEAAGQWVKSRVDAEQLQEAMEAAAAAMAEEMPRLDPLEGPTEVNADLATLYTLTDCHVGMLAWRKEGGDDWDLRIAERKLVSCFDHMIAGAPPSGVGIVNQLGDFLHSDGLLPVTPTSGHVLDQDGRFSKMVGVAIRVLRRCVDAALMKHDRVVVIMAEGNHDMASSVWLRHMFKALYENEPRLHVIDSELPYYSYQHGETALFFHHGHLKKPDDFPLVFAAQFPVVWGQTRRRYAHAGHRHHHYEREHGGLTVLQHPTLAARDAYASRGGWFAERAIYAITYHKGHGEVARSTVYPEMVT